MPEDAVTVGPGGRHVARTTPDRRAVELHEPGAGRAPAVLTGGGKVALALGFSPDGRQLAVGDDGWRVRAWDTRTAALVCDIEVGERAHGVAWSPGGTRLAVGTRGGFAIECNPAAGKRAGLSFRHDTQVGAVAYSPDGAALATIADDGREHTTLLWPTRLGPPHRPLVLHRRVRTAGPRFTLAGLQFSPDGRLLSVSPYLYAQPRRDDVLLRLPPPPAGFREARLRTWVSIGVRRLPTGEFGPIPPEEWSVLRDELSALDRATPPPPWERLEVAFEQDLRARVEQARAAAAALGRPAGMLEIAPPPRLIR
jgi:hypothetical protein